MNPFLRQYYLGNNQSRWGSQLNITGAIGITQTPQITYKNSGYISKMNQNVDKFISQNYGTQNSYQTFKGILSERISTAQNCTSNYSLQQIANIFPWIFSANVLFEPLRTILYSMKSGFTQIQALKQSNNLPAVMINSQAVQAVYESLRYGRNFIEKAALIFQQNYTPFFTSVIKYIIGSIAGMVQSMKTSAQKVWKSITQGLNNSKQYLAKFITKAIELFKSTTQLKTSDYWSTYFKQAGEEKDKQTLKTTRQVMQVILNNLFKSLKVYGAMIINFTYLEAVYDKRIIKGTTYYYLPAQSDIYIACVQSFAKIYKQDDLGNLIQIPQTSFNIQYLREMCRKQILKQGMNLVKTMNDQRTIPQKEMKPVKQFNTKYLNTGSIVSRYDRKRSQVVKEFYSKPTRTANDISNLKEKLQSIDAFKNQHGGKETDEEWKDFLKILQPQKNIPIVSNTTT